MKNLVVDGYEARDIDAQVTKIIRGLGNPEPPISLDDLRQLLDLDRQFYSSDDQTFVSEIVSRIKVAGKQILKRPTILIDAIKKAKLSALWIPDKKRILLDQNLPILKHRWNEAHEIGHSIIPWHREFLHGDNKSTLHPECHQQIEAEANFAAGRLLLSQACRFSQGDRRLVEKESCRDRTVAGNAKRLRATSPLHRRLGEIADAARVAHDASGPRCRRRLHQGAGK
jgi:Zn-dependent peptidase ImmA (M78 family)